MQKRSTRWLIAAVALLAMLFTGCADKTEEIVGMVGETPIYQWYVDAASVNQATLQELYSTGVNITQPGYEKELVELKKVMLNEAAAEAAIWEQARLMGISDLTPEQEAEVDKKYLEQYTAQIETFMAQYGTDDAGRKKAEQAYLDLLKKSSLNPERMREGLRYNYISSLYMEEMLKDQPITEEQIAQAYQQQLENDQKEYTENPAAFGENVTDTTVYFPEGYYDTVRLTLKFNTKQEQEIATAYNALKEASTAYVQAVTEKGEASLDAKNHQAAVTRTKENFEAVYEKCYVELENEIAPIRNEILAGADFIKTMESRSQDNHLMSYFVCKDSTHVEESYLAAAMALQEEGDISEPVRLEKGVCIIKLLEKVEPGVRSLEEMHEDIRKELNSARKQNLYRQAQTDLLAAAEEAGLVALYPEKLS